MSLYEISNEILMVAVNSMGAELNSLKDCATGKEYLWSGDPAYWKGRSPLLFPFIGGLKNGGYIADGRTYRIGKHGFARNKEFQLTNIQASEIWFHLTSDEETLPVYPYDFRLEQGYRLEGRMLEVLWKVTNTGTDTMFFSIGGHPALRCPGPVNENTGDITPSFRRREDGYLLFDREGTLRSTVIGDADGLAAHEYREYPLTDGALRITEELFDHDALVLEDHQVGRICFAGPDRRPYAAVEFKSPVVGIWSPPSSGGDSAPFICIEPWYGLCDSTDFHGSIDERKWTNRLEAGERFEAGYRIEILPE